MGAAESRVVVTEQHASSAMQPIIVHLPSRPEDYVAALVNAWTGRGLAISDRRSALRFEAGECPDALVYYAVLYGFTNRWVDVHVNGVPVDFQRIYEESRRLPDAGRPAEHLEWAQLGGDDPGCLPHAAVETAADLTPETVTLIRYASRLRMVPPARTKAALTCFARVAGIRLARQERFPFLSTGGEPAPAGKKSPDQGIDLEYLRRSVTPHRKIRKREVFDTVSPGDYQERFRRLADANDTPIESVLLRLGASGTDGAWTCPRVTARSDHDPRPSLHLRRNRGRCPACDPARLTPAELVAQTLDITPDEAASLILQPGRDITRPAPGFRLPELSAPPQAGTLVTAYVSTTKPDRFDCVIYDAGIGHPREAIIWRPDTANLPPDVAAVELQPGDTVTALVTDTTGAYHLSIDAPELAVRALASQVPEIIDGTVRVVAVERKLGSRTKVAVAPTVPRLNAVGVSLGKRENHYHLAAAHRLLNRHRPAVPPDEQERLEIIAYSRDPRTYLVNAMRPTEVIDCRIRDGHAVAAVTSHQYRGGVGRGGLNAELAGRLTGLYVEVVPAGTDLDTALDALIRRSRS